ncbi:carbon-nitrogen hydrolase family protein [Corallincola spongiicola]|nr:carbon-nitrogen hydrolase family protein [Corallincola spongiicola]
MSWLSAVQMVSGPIPADNFARLVVLLSKLPEHRPQLVVLPESVLCFGGDPQALQTIAESPNDGPIQRQLAALAKQFQLWLVAGSFPLRADDQVTACSLLFSPAGETIAKYDKIHLFDVDVDDATGRYRESDQYLHGATPTVVPTPLGNLGMAVCYDLRFPEQFRWMRQQGADVISLPAAFTQVTGEAHWHTLIRARAIENQCYLVAADQGGVHADGRETFGHSMIVDPWGEVVAELEKGEGVISVAMDSEKMARIRSNMPVSQHARFHCHWGKES